MQSSNISRIKGKMQQLLQQTEITAILLDNMMHCTKFVNIDITKNLCTFCCEIIV